MKNSNKILALFAICQLLILPAINGYAQTQPENDQDGKTAAIAELIRNKNFVFVAQTASPVRGGLRQLTTTYELRVSGDTIAADLPYFGRAYTAPIDPASGGIRFTSTSFSYNEKARRKGGWDINIKPNSEDAARQLSLNVTESGYASLQVTSNNRQPISFSGYIREKRR